MRDNLSLPTWPEGACALQSSQHVFRTGSQNFAALLNKVELAARHDVCILVLGETGTGKTSIARLIHDLSLRRGRPFFVVGCGSTSNELFASELFGCAQQFSDANLGKFSAANGGTILLDEVDALSLEHQLMLLRVLESGEFEPLRPHNTQRANVRIVATSNLQLDKMVEQERFRKDLYYRLHQVPILLPPLRERREDILPIATDFLLEVEQELGITVREVTSSFYAALEQHSWPGNIRELKSEIRQAVLFSRGEPLTWDSLTSGVKRSYVDSTTPRSSGREPSRLASNVSLTEQAAIEQMLKSMGHNRAATARALGISRVTLYNKMRKYGIANDQE